MRFFCIQLILFFAVINTISATVPITIKISDPTDRFIFLKLKDKADANLLRVDLRADNSSTFHYDLKEDGFLELTYQGQNFPLYLQMNDAIEISFNGRDLKNTLAFSGAGASNNKLIAAYLKRFGSLQKSHFESGYLSVEFDSNILSDIQSMSASQFNSNENNQLNEKINLINGSSANSFLKEKYTKKAHWENAVHKISWLATKYQEQTPSELQNNLNAMGLNNPKYLNSESEVDNIDYKNFLNAYVIYKYLPEDPFKYNIHPKLYDIINRSFTGKVNWYAKSHLLIKVFERSGNADLGRDKIGEFANSCPYPEYQEQIMAMYGGEISGVADVLAPDIDMVDKEGNLISLSDYKGKVVYISFWASWCKPCIAGFKKNKELRQRLSDMGVVLLNVSIDKKNEAWVDAMVRYRPVGVNGLVLSFSDVSKDYDISAIPLYHIVDKNGKFTYLSENAGRDILGEFEILTRK